MKSRLVRGLVTRTGREERGEGCPMHSIEVRSSHRGERPRLPDAVNDQNADALR